MAILKFQCKHDLGEVMVLIQNFLFIALYLSCY